MKKITGFRDVEVKHARKRDCLVYECDGRIRLAFSDMAGFSADLSIKQTRYLIELLTNAADRVEAEDLLRDVEALVREPSI